jgi:hypothetical protein
MLAAIQFRTFYFFYMGVKLGLVTLKEEHRLEVFENRVLRGIVGPKREDVLGCWRRLHNEELYSMCFTKYYGVKSRTRCVGHAYKMLVGKPER